MPKISHFTSLRTSTSSRKTYNIGGFRGVDYSSPTFEVNENRAIDILNFVRKDNVLEKREGLNHLKNISDKSIRNIWLFNGKFVVNAGGDILITDTEFSTTIKSYLGKTLDRYINAFYKNKKLWILGGLKFLVLDKDFNISNVEDIAEVPTTTIGILPNNLDNIIDSNRENLDKYNNLTYFHINELTSGIGDNDIVDLKKELHYELDNVVSIKDKGQDIPKISLNISYDPIRMTNFVSDLQYFVTNWKIYGESESVTGKYVKKKQIAGGNLQVELHLSGKSETNVIDFSHLILNEEFNGVVYKKQLPNITQAEDYFGPVVKSIFNVSTSSVTVPWDKALYVSYKAYVSYGEIVSDEFVLYYYYSAITLLKTPTGDRVPESVFHEETLQGTYNESSHVASWRYDVPLGLDESDNVLNSDNIKVAYVIYSKDTIPEEYDEVWLLYIGENEDIHIDLTDGKIISFETNYAGNDEMTFDLGNQGGIGLPTDKNVKMHQVIIFGTNLVIDPIYDTETKALTFRTRLLPDFAREKINLGTN